ncbi:MAG: hypothetical protein M3Y27_08690 [Acidobacteriota bacterium]|nr:hypothetical protein [Acidobacteriota bacterium]
MSAVDLFSSTDHPGAANDRAATSPDEFEVDSISLAVFVGGARRSLPFARCAMQFFRQQHRI